MYILIIALHRFLSNQMFSTHKIPLILQFMEAFESQVPKKCELLVTTTLKTIFGSTEFLQMLSQLAKVWTKSFILSNIATAVKGLLLCWFFFITVSCVVKELLISNLFTVTVFEACMSSLCHHVVVYQPLKLYCRYVCFLRWLFFQKQIHKPYIISCY